MAPLEGFEVRRDVAPGVYRLTEVFTGLENSPTLREVFGDGDLRQVLDSVRVEASDRRMYMRVSNEDGRVIVGLQYLREGEALSIYLDLVHELTHVNQFLRGMELYEKSVDYVERPTEMEAFAMAVKEARRLGMSDEEIADYLKVEWMSNEDHRRLLEKLGVKAPAG